MASATFQLKAVDQTAQAFASVQNKLTKMHATAKQVGVGLATFFGFGAVVGGVKRLDAFLSDAEKNAKKLGLTSEDLDKLTVATGFADDAAMKLQNTVALAAAKLAGAFTGGNIAARAAEIRITRVADALEELKKSTKEIYLDIDNISNSQAANFAAIGDKIAKINREMDASNASVDALKNAERTKQIAGLQKEQAEMALSAFQGVGEAMAQSAKAEENYSFSLMTEAEQQKKINSELHIKENLLKLIKSRLGDKFENFDITSATPEDIALMTAMKNELEKYVELQNKRKAIETDLQVIARISGDMISSAFEDAILSGQKLGDVLRSLGQDLLRLVFSQTITSPLAGGISTALKAMFMAEGGPVSAGSPYIVGERGPELFVPSSSGSIVSNSKMSSGGGAMGGVTVNYNIAAGVSRSELVPILEQERRRLKAEIPDMVRRGGSYRSAFA
jgi:hypothetical protein